MKIKLIISREVKTFETVSRMINVNIEAGFGTEIDENSYM